MFKRIFRILVKIVLGFLGVVLLYLTLAVVLSFIPTNTKELNCEKDCLLYASTNGIHADLILPVEQLSSELQEQLKIEPSTTFIGFGWGDKKFYLETPTWADLKFSTAMQAMFWKSETAMHVTYYRQTADKWKSISICENQNEKLNNFVKNSFELGESQQTIWTAKGYSRYDEFYEAEGNYSCIKTCNVWVNQALKQAKIRTPIWSPFDWGVLRHFY